MTLTSSLRRAAHAEPTKSWTVEGLGPPMQYLTMWRRQLASRQLIEGGPVAAVAAAVGYESEAAFSRAFKELVGQAPATRRRCAR
jgi:AraC-like DNA-binding protein